MFLIVLVALMGVSISSAFSRHPWSINRAPPPSFLLPTTPTRNTPRQNFGTNRRLPSKTPAVGVAGSLRKMTNADDDSAKNGKVEDTTGEGGSVTKKDHAGDKPPVSGVKKIIGRVLLGLSFTWSYLNIFLGVGLSCGLVLNLLGYGYQVTGHGIIIETLDQMRADSQWQNAVAESMQEVVKQ